jgi:hypothetical protein
VNKAVCFVDPVAAVAGQGERMGERPQGSSISGSNLVLEPEVEMALDIDLKVEAGPTPADV